MDLGVDARERTREWNRLADVLEAADPRDGTLDAHAEAGVRDASVLAQVEIPLEGFFGELVLLDALREFLVGADALRAADDLAVSFGRENVDAKCFRRVARVGLHVEGLHLRRIAMHHDGAVE